MKKVIASIGMVALGASVVEAAPQMGLSRQETTKPWSVSAAVRGFYDDNYNTQSSNLRRDSFGIEIVPSAGLNIIREQTAINATAKYGARWYEDRIDHEWDQTVVFDGRLTHNFSEQYRINVSENFTYASEPSLLDSSGFVATPLRLDYSNIRNIARVHFEGDISQRFGFEVGYQNTLFDYEQSGVVGSYSALLDRMEHLPSVGLKYFVNPDTVARLGYQYSDVHYTSDDLLVGAPSNVTAETRDSRTHFYFLGLDHTFNPRLSTAVRGGAMTVSYPNDAVAKTRTNPYADLSITYRYLEGCYAQAGFRYSRTATDQVAYNAPDGSLVLDAEASLVYFNVVHAITSKLSANLLGGWQHSKFRGGTVNGESDDYMTLSLGLSYEINKYFSAEAGYNFDTLWSNIANNGAPGRNYHRNYAFIGVKGTL